MSIARAFVNRPLILLADEPTGNLDPATSVGIMRLLDRINRTGHHRGHGHPRPQHRRHHAAPGDRAGPRLDHPRPGPRRLRVGTSTMAINVDYVVRETAANLTRNITLTVASVLTVFVSLAIVGHHRAGAPGRAEPHRPVRGRRRVHRLHGARHHRRPRSTRCGKSLDDNPERRRRHLRRPRRRPTRTSRSSSRARTRCSRTSRAERPAHQLPGRARSTQRRHRCTGLVELLPQAARRLRGRAPPPRSSGR